MNTKLTIKNFRVFDEDGVTVDLKPITILTGCNSSGKSSVVKAALILNEFWKKQKDIINIDNIIIDFSAYPLNLLGNFNKVLHDGSESKKLYFEYTVYSYLISKEVTVKLQFSKRDDDKLSRIRLDRIEMLTEDGTILFQDIEESEGEYFDLDCLTSDGKLEEGKKLQTVKRKDYIKYTQVNLNLIKEQFLDFLTLGSLFSKFKSLNDFKCIGGPQEEDNFNNSLPILREYMSKCRCKDENRIKDVQSAISLLSRLFYYRMERTSDFRKSDFLNNYVDLFEFVEKALKLGSLFYIPILDEMALNKDAFIKYIKDNDLESIGESQTIIDEFMASECATFTEYFKLKELEYGSNYDINNPFNDTGFSSTRIYKVVMSWNEKQFPQESKYYSKSKSSFDNPLGGEWIHTMEINFNKYAYSFIKECLNPLLDEIAYVSSSRATIKRLYQLDQRDDFTQLLKNYSGNYSRSKYINKWIKAFGIGDSISFDVDEDGVGVKIFLHKTPDDVKGRLLADEGYGITQLLSIMLQIEMSHDITIAIEEPEIHLHPKYQSLLADMFVDAYKEREIHFIIETHSEYLIRRLQLLVAGVDVDEKQRLDKDEVSIAYIYSKEEAEKAGQPIVKNIAICEDGYLDDTFGSGFFDEATNLSRKLM